MRKGRGSETLYVGMICCGFGKSVGELRVTLDGELRKWGGQRRQELGHPAQGSLRIGIFVDLGFEIGFAIPCKLYIEFVLCCFMEFLMNIGFKGGLASVCNFRHVVSDIRLRQDDMGWRMPDKKCCKH